jgi:hypothetical protein
MLNVDLKVMEKEEEETARETVYADMKIVVQKMKEEEETDLEVMDQETTKTLMDMTMVLVKDQTVVKVTGTVLTPGLLQTLKISHANLKVMTNAGGNGLRRTLPAVTKTTNAGNLSLTTTLVRTKKDKKTDPNLKDHHVILVTGTALTPGLLLTLRKLLVVRTILSAGSDLCLRTLPAKKKTKTAGCPSLSTTSLKRRMLLCVLKSLHQDVATKTGDVKKLGSWMWLLMSLRNFLVVLRTTICAGLLLS